MRLIDHRYRRGFTFQWHLTSKCGYRCAHCYDGPSTDRAAAAVVGDAEAIIQRLVAFYTDLETHFGHPFGRYVVLTGGDPLLCDRFDTIVSRLDGLGFRIGLLGCPDTVTAEKIELLKRHRVRSIQFSVDGLKETHDGIRGKPGSFEQTIEKTLRLQGQFTINLMATISRENIDEMVPLITYLDAVGVQRFDFARVSFLGNASTMECLTPEAYRSFLSDIFDLERSLIDRNSALTIGKKDNLWRLLYHEKGLLPLPREKTAQTGCPCGFTSLTILPDGEVHVCRRCDSKVGTLPDDDIFHLYLNSKITKQFRDVSRIEGCSICRLRTVCRGCPAVGASRYGHLGRRDPQCWRIVMP